MNENLYRFKWWINQNATCTEYKSKIKSPKKNPMEIKTIIIILSWNNCENVAQQHVLDTLLRSHHAFHASVFLNNSKYIKKFNIRLTSHEWLNDFFHLFYIMFCFVVICSWNEQRQFIIIIIINISFMMITFIIWSEVKWTSKKGASNIKTKSFKQ